MPTHQKRSIDSPEETRTFKTHGHLDVVTLGDEPCVMYDTGVASYAKAA
jgi:hypothetical protein